MITKLVNIRDLIGKADGIKADVRSRHADGSLYYQEQDKHHPRNVTLGEFKITKHEEGTRNGVPWVYWRYRGYGCGMSGETISYNDKNPVFILIEQNGNK